MLETNFVAPFSNHLVTKYRHYFNVSQEEEPVEESSTQKIIIMVTTILYITLNHMKCVTLNGRRPNPKWKRTKMEDDKNRRQPKWKMTKMEDYQKWKTILR